MRIPSANFEKMNIIIILKIKIWRQFSKKTLMIFLKYCTVSSDFRPQFSVIIQSHRQKQFGKLLRILKIQYLQDSAELNSSQTDTAKSPTERCTGHNWVMGKKTQQNQWQNWFSFLIRRGLCEFDLLKSQNTWFV